MAEEDIPKAFAAIQNDQFNKVHYTNLISLLTPYKELQNELDETYKSMHDLFHLTESEWDAWLAIISGPEELDAYFQLRLSDSQTVTKVWLKYLDHHHAVRGTRYDQILTTAIHDTAFDIADNHLLYAHAISHITDHDRLEQITELILKSPHVHLDQILDAYSALVSSSSTAGPAAHYESKLLQARKLASRWAPLLDFVEKKEVEVYTEADRPEFWVAYLNMKGHKRFRQLDSLAAVFERAVYDKSDPRFLAVWEAYIDLLYELNASAQNLADITYRFVKRYPRDPRSWAAYIRNLESHEELKFVTARERIIASKILPDRDTPYTDKKALLQAMVSYVSRSQLITKYKNDLNFYFDLSLKQNDKTQEIERLIIQAFEIAKDWDSVQRFLARLTDDAFHGYSARLWLLRFRYETEKSPNAKDTKQLLKLVKEAISASPILDNPSLVIEEVSRYSLLHFDVVTQWMVKRLINKVYTGDKIPVPDKKRAYEEEPEALDKKLKKQKPVEKVRDREHLTVLVKNLPSTITTSQLATFFEGCDPIKKITIKDTTASVEFGTKHAMLAALTKSFKKIDSNEVTVEQAFNTTVWVTNFPPSADKAWLHELFSRFGEIIEVRLPSLKTNAARRFSYIEYSLSSSAQHACAQLDGADFDGYTLQVKISDPDARQTRSGPTEEGRELFVCKIDFNSTTADKIREVFSKYGALEAVKMPLGPKGQRAGRLHDGYAFVTFVDPREAEKACEELNATTLDGRVIDVTIAKPKPKARAVIREPRPNTETAASASSTSSNTTDTIQAKTLTVSNIPETCNAARLKAFLESVGPVMKVDLNTQTQSAVVEYVKVADAGAAMMKLAGSSLDGNQIVVTERRHEPRRLNRAQRRAILRASSDSTMPVSTAEPITTASETKEPQRMNRAQRRALVNAENNNNNNSTTTTGLSNDDFRNLFKK